MASPGIHTLLTRPRLLDALSNAVPFVALIGPRGAGASTLLRQWAEGRPGVVWGRPGAIPAPDGDGPVIVDRADELDEDDWRSIDELREAQPDRLIRVALRSHTQLPHLDDIEIVTGLRFTSGETAEFLSGIGSSLDPVAVHRLTGGLPAAVRVVAQLNSVRDVPLRRALAALRYDALPGDRAVLAIPEVLTPEVVAALGGPEDFIDEAERAGLGEWEPDAHLPCFVLSAPVRAATLAAHAIRDDRAARDTAAQVLLDQQAWFGALRQGAASGSLPIVDRALKQGGLPLLREHASEILAALRDFPVLQLRHWPVVAMAQGLILNARHTQRLRAIELLGVALLGAQVSPAGSGERALMRVIESVVRRLLGMGDGGVQAASAAAKILADLPPPELESIGGLLGDLHVHAGISLAYGGMRSEALAQFEYAHARAERPGIELLGLGGAAMAHALAGDIEIAQQWVDAALERPWARRDRNGYAGSLLSIAEAKIAIERGGFADAELAIERVWHIIDTIEHWPILAHLRGVIDLARGEAAAGLERLRLLRRNRGSRMPYALSRLLDLTEASLSVASGDLSAARSFKVQANDPPMVVIGAARFAITAGFPERALRIQSEAAQDGPEARACAAIVEALVLRDAGREVDAAFAAARARTIADSHGLTTPFLLVPPDERAAFGGSAGAGVRAAAAASAHSPDHVAPLHPAPTPVIPVLTDRERVILRELLVTGSASEIADRLFVSVNTVKSQRRSLYRKLGASSREEALSVAAGLGLLGR